MSFNQGGSNFQPGTAGVATSMVELSISARNLADLDITSKSDPMCVVFLKPFGEPINSSNWQELIRTEKIENTLNPDFAKKLQINYCFEQQQHLKFEFYDVDSSSTRLSDHDFLGSVITTLGQIVSSGGGVGSQGSGLKLPLSNPERRGSKVGEIMIKSEELSTCKDELELQFIGKKLDKKDFFGSSDPFLQISRANETPNDFTLVHRTEHINNNVNPTWKKFIIPLRTLCNGDIDRNLKVECFDYNNNGKHSFIGEFNVTARQLMEGPGPSNIHPCINKKKKDKKSYKNSGEIHMTYLQLRKAYSFLDYVKGGTELACTFAIDFTASNGNPTSPESLHYFLPNGFNQYEIAIQSVGQIIEDYDSDKLFPVLGFGARIPPTGQVSHEFYVNGHPSNPYCERISGVLTAYKSCMSRIQLYGPTNFSPVINHVSNIARNFVDGSQYFILLIITDGVITDIEQTKTAIVDSAKLPMSIIIVGVGGADFDAMEELDGDTVRVTSSDGRVACRDIVQFVPYRNFLGLGRGGTDMAGLQLAKEVLAEIPEQFVGYMKANKIVPKMGGSTTTNVPPDPEAVRQF